MKEIQHATKRTSHVIDIPNLVELQLNSYKWFLEEGLQELFDSFSPIYDFTGNTSISLMDFTLGEPKYSVEECRDRDMTFESPIKARVLLKQANKEEIESEVYLGDLPLMTDKGTFVINGAERVVVSQLARSPGVYFKDNLDFSGRVLFYATIIPQEGAWVDVETDANSQVTVRIGQTRKFPITTLLRALNAFPQAVVPIEMPIREVLERFWVYKNVEINDEQGRLLRTEVQKDFFQALRLAAPVIDPKGKKIVAEENALATEAFLQDLAQKVGEDTVIQLYSPTENTNDILDLFSTRITLENPTAEQLLHKRPTEDIVDASGKVLVKAYQQIPDKTTANAIVKLKLPTLEVLEVNRYIEATIEQDVATDTASALLDIYRKIRPGDPATPESARNLLQSIFYDIRRYDMAKVGRYKMNKKLGATLPLTARTLTREDLVSILRYIINLHAGAPEAATDDIDHLENKRVRSVGELLYSQLRMGFLRMEKVAKERMTSLDSDSIIPQVILSVKPISASIKSFFGSSQLSQFMDQTNPLTELSHKRRLSALGPGGLSRQSAKLEVRDVHHSHYGRICPIETPEGPNIGLVGAVAVYARIDPYGFLETPYRKVHNGVVTDEIVWMTADEDHKYYIAPANLKLDEHNHFVDAEVQVRYEESYPIVKPNRVQFMDVAPVQLISIATGLIPFVENDEATRALMGSNMQRQAVPTLRPDAPLVKTGLEKRAARDSGAVIIARRSGVVTRVTAEQIDVTTPDGRIDSYRLINLLRSNQSTCITQRPIVNKGQRVRQGQVLADGPCTENGELALGQNVLVAFMPWGGYNYEDAILLSERLVKDDVFTSIHIEEFDKEARDTKLGPEEITRDIPNVGEDMLKDLNEDGIVRIGAEVRPEDILVGEVAPKGQGELTAEERLIIAIFGKKAEETRDVSLRVPHGNGGRVVDVKVFSRFKYQGSRDKRIYNFCKRPDASMRDLEDGELLRLPADELNAGVNMLVRVYIAQKRKVMEGDKMAGRHGNKGVISKILPEEDMPFLPDGTPVDIVLNPLGVPSRMNIGQILETHLGYVGKHLNCSFVNPAFEGSTEPEILSEMERLAAHLRRRTLENYVNSELGLGMQFAPDAAPEAMLDAIRERLRGFDAARLEEVSRIVAAPPVISPVVRELHAGDGDGAAALPSGAAEAQAHGNGAQASQTSEPLSVPADYNLDEVLERIRKNAWERAGYDPHTGKTYLRDGLTGDTFDMPVTVGVIYMLKLAHLVDDKIHARSTGPYSLVTQQPLGGKAQFGGQRFGEMEVWALEAYGAAHTLQEILTIKSDDVLGRVKTYESIVKGDSMLEPGVPESFKILVNELQSLGLKVTVLDEQDREIDLRDRDDDIDPHEDPVKAAARRRQRALRLESDEPTF
ncbi:MAG TPA: DNA-directed RNA polymerase subunit beta [Chthonomonadaceae bacterium]|nr:DNA-directed RNA polymerase subunit beta [Chthonomonadaceae bacterium]